MFSLLKRFIKAPNGTPTDQDRDKSAQKKEEGDRYLSLGDTTNAERCYREAHQRDKKNSDALINLAYILTENNENSEAIHYLEKALLISPNNPDIFFLLGLANKNSGNIKSALEQYKNATNVKADFESAHLEVCKCFLLLNRKSEALEAITKGALTNPASASVHHLRGSTLASLGDIEEAINEFKSAVSLQPNFSDALINLGMAYKLQGNYTSSLEYYRMALKTNPSDSTILTNIGELLVKTGEFNLAIDSYRKAISTNPLNSAALTGIALALHKSGDLGGAIDYHEKALAISPNSSTSNCFYGITLQALGQIDRAIQAYSRAISINPEYAEAYNNLAGALHEKNDLIPAIGHLERAIAIDPSFADAHSNLGVALYEQGKTEESIASFYRALEANPEHVAAHSSLLFVMSFSQKHSPEEYLSEAKRFGEKISRSVKQAYDSYHCQIKERPLRVGLVSGDLRTHPVGYFLESIIQHIDPKIIELHAYPTNDLEDLLSKRLRKHLKGWKPITWLSNESAAQLIHDDQVDILIDLAGHSAHNRLPVFAWRPAPIQVSWLGFFASTGLAEIDYILVDPNSVPPDGHRHYSETPCFLPETRLCFTPPTISEAPSVSPLPALHRGHITFGCFQNQTKLNDAVLTLWGTIAQAIPDARFRFQIKQLNCDRNRKALEERLSKFGIPAERTSLFGPQSRSEYLAAHADVDIILDTFPYTGGTTTCEALWMGVPTLTLLGNTMLSRQGASIMSCAGLPDWVADDDNTYRRKAIAYANDINHLSELRRTLRERVSRTPLFDAKRFAKILETKLTELTQNADT